MDKYKKLLPSKMKYPLLAEVLDNLLDKWALGIRLGMPKCYGEMHAGGTH